MAADAGVERACAKINLGLKVLGRRADGYHDICSLVQSVDLADRLTFRPAPRMELSCSDPALSIGPDNLVLRAAELFCARAGEARAFHIHLDKEIPMGAGLGGGSADAAAVLRALNRRCGAPFSASQLRQLGERLGSDVPFLVEGGTAIMRGRGELLQPLHWQLRADICYVLVWPGVAVSTAWAYAQIEPVLTGESPYLKFLASLGGGCADHRTLCEAIENDFLPVVERTYPIVADLRSRLVRTGALCASMSGSGSTVYGIFDDRSAASQAHALLQGQGFRSFLCQPSGLDGQRNSG